MTRRDGSARVAEALRAAPPCLDELRRARIERRLLDHLPEPALDRLGAALNSEHAQPDAARKGMGARARAAWAAGGALVAMAAALALAWVAWPRDHVEVARFELSGTSTASGTIDVGRTLELGEGEHAQVQIGGVGIEVAGHHAAAPAEGAATSRSTVMRFVSLDVRHVEVELTEGSIDVAFHPRERGRERLSIETPSARVEVVGTEFSVRLEGETTRVSVRHGVVRVIPHAAGQRAVLVHAGESVAVGERVADAPHAASTPDDVPNESATDAPEVLAAVSTTSPTRTAPRTSAPAVPIATPGASVAPAELEILEPTPAVVDRPQVVPVSAALRLAAAQRVLAEGNHVRARRMFAEVMRASDASIDVRVSAQTELGDSYYSTREWQRAAREYELAAEVGRGRPIGDAAIFALARAHQRLGDREAAKRTYLRYLDEAPHGANASQARMAICNLGGDPSVECGGSAR